MRLYNYFRSSASYRVRIALALKGLDWQHVGVDIRSGVQNEATFRARNPNGLVPAFERRRGDSVSRLGQSLAIIEYLE